LQNPILQIKKTETQNNNSKSFLKLLAIVDNKKALIFNGNKIIEAKQGSIFSFSFFKKEASYNSINNHDSNEKKIKDKKIKITQKLKILKIDSLNNKVILLNINTGKKIILTLKNNKKGEE